MKKFMILMFLSVMTVSVHGFAAETRRATVYKNPECGCCNNYIDYLRQHGFSVRAENTHDLALIKREHAVPAPLGGCHTTLIDGYVVEGHVPVNVLNRLLTEKPPITGISLPGMPQGSPGMSGRKSQPFTIYEITPGKPKVYAVE